MKGLVAWFYTFVTIAVCVGTLTPPVALTLYLTSQMADERTFARIIPYLTCMVVILILAFL